MQRRDLLKSTLAGMALAGTGTVAAPRLARAAGSSVLKFVPHADLASLDPV